MPSTLYITDLSPFGARMRLVAAFTGVSIPETAPPGGSGSDAMKAISHFGKTPAITVEGRVLIESLPLMEYLVDRAGGGALMPESAEERAAMRGIMAAHDFHVLGAIWPLFLQLRGDNPDPTVAASALKAAAAQYEVLTRLFDSEGGFALGGRVTLADLAIVPFALLLGTLYPMFGEVSPFETQPRLARWWAEISAVSQVIHATTAMNTAIAKAFGPH